MKALFTIDLGISRVQIVRDARDLVYFEIAKTDQFDQELPYSNLHKEYEEFNDRIMKIDTVKGNGPRMARLLGWPGDIEIISIKGGLSFVKAWSDEEIKPLPFSGASAYGMADIDFPDEYDVILRVPDADNMSIGGMLSKHKIGVMKALREVCHFSIAEVKKIVYNVPSTVKSGISKFEAEEIVKAITDAGGKAEIKPS